MNRIALGIDTSNYKTSVAITDESGRVLYQRSEFLKVEQGKRGLRQSEAFFHHCQVLPSFIEEGFEQVNPKDITSIAVSSRPRNVEGSYMPVFLAGIQTGQIISAALQVPLKKFSHQEGHIEAILSSLPDVKEERFILFHLSGGTTECLLCQRTDWGYDAEIIGGTKDISMGQLLDRAGVHLGYAFPSGKYLDRIAMTHPVTLRPSKVKIQKGYFNLSGMETQVKKSIEQEGDRIIPGIFFELQRVLHQTAKELSKAYDVPTVVMAGGVSSSDTLRNYSKSWDEKEDGCQIFFGDPVLSGDNAVGISILGGRCRNEAR
ncbi:MAG: O-sialoglycoprotein endopeptidase [Eubacteriales bacterium]|nr:O-sialoglycoprotein endopeptidase [Eubacteriales bacterium]